MFKEEFAFFVKNQERLVKQYPGRALAIEGEDIVGVYDSPLEAYLEIQRKSQLGKVMVQLCLPGPEAYTITIN